MPHRPPVHNARVRDRAAALVVPVRPKCHESRGSAASRGYGRKWREARAGFLAKHPLCVHCLGRGHVTGATEVDHIQPHRGDEVLFWASEWNWQSLCHTCHSEKTVREDGGFGRQRKER